jgi:hypothetical protein
MAQRVGSSVVVEAPLARVCEYWSNPENLSNLMTNIEGRATPEAMKQFTDHRRERAGFPDLRRGPCSRGRPRFAPAAPAQPFCPSLGSLP